VPLPSSIVHLLAYAIAGSAPAIDDGLFRPPSEAFGRISPDGRSLTVVTNRDGYQALERIDLELATRRTFFSTEILQAGESTITGLEWVDSDTVIVAVVQLTEGIAKLSDTRNKRHVFVIDLDQETPTVRFIESGGVLVDALPTEENAILYATSGSTSIVYRIDTGQLHEWGKALPKTARIDGGQFSRNNRVAEMDGVVIRWMTVSGGTVRAALLWKQDDGFSLLMRDDQASDWRVEHRWSVDERNRKRSRGKDTKESGEDAIPIPVSLIEGTNEFVVLAEDDSGRNAVYRYNFASQQRSLIFQHPSAEVVSVGLDQEKTGVLYVSYFEDGVVKYDYIGGLYQDVASHLIRHYPGHTANVVATDEQENVFFAYMQSPTQPGKALMFNRTSRQMKELFSVMPWIDEAALAPSIAGTVDVHGLAIEYFLTVPHTIERVPLLVYPHGGPWGISDNRQFNPVVQYLASLGMAVLQVNYRGSGGYGAEFLEQGEGEFGKRMLDDIEAAMDVAVDHPSIDANRICAIGESYGGYAALMLAIRSPQRFRCAASYAGVTDLGLLLGSYEKEVGDFLLSRLIAEKLPVDQQYEQLRKLSPVYNVEQLQVPVYLAHGSDDIRVDIEHSYRMMSRMRQLDKNLVWRELPNHGHSFDDPQSALAYYRSLADFLKENLSTVPAL
jgi:dipeptidyl aminopeptidase/acylaminoacyl peptidase